MVVDRSANEIQYEQNGGDKWHYEFIAEMTADEFFLLTNALGESFGVLPRRKSIPEADIATIILPYGKIYAEYDLDYGVEIECSEFSRDQRLQLESILSTY